MTLAIGLSSDGSTLRASSLLSRSTMNHALCTPSEHPKSAWVMKCEPVRSNSSAARAHAYAVFSCGTSIRNLCTEASIAIALVLNHVDQRGASVSARDPRLRGATRLPLTATGTPGNLRARGALAAARPSWLRARPRAIVARYRRQGWLQIHATATPCCNQC